MFDEQLKLVKSKEVFLKTVFGNWKSAIILQGVSIILLSTSRENTLGAPLEIDSQS